MSGREGKVSGEVATEGKESSEGANSYNELAKALPGCRVPDALLIRASDWFAGQGRRGSKSKSKLSTFDQFADDKCDLFENENEDVSDLGDGTGVALELEECHREFLQLFEDQIEEFIAQEGGTIEEFFNDCQKAMKGESMTIFANEDHKWFVDVMLRALDYQVFHRDMVRKARARGHRGSQSSKSSKGK
jgi:hypothetical protein